MKARIARSRLMRVLALMGRKVVPYFFALLILGLSIAFCFNLVLGFVFKDILDAALAGDSSLLLRGAILALAAFAVGLPGVVLSRIVAVRAVCKTMTFLRVSVFSKVARLPMALVEERHSGDLISRATNDVQTIWSMLFDSMPSFASALCMGSIGLGAIFFLEWRLGIVVVLVGAVSFATSTGFARILRKRSEVLQAAVGTMTERLTNLVAGISAARMFQLEGTLHSEYAAATDGAARNTIAHARAQAAFEVAQGLLDWIQRFGTLAMGLMLYSRGYLLVGAVWAIVHMQGNASFLFTSIGQFITGIQRGLTGGQRVFEILDGPEEPAPADALPKGAVSVEASLCLDAVSFSYAEQGEDFVLRDLSLNVMPGSAVALVGPSGGGKSTVLKLLLGFHVPQAGAVRIGGIPITDQTLHRLRDQTAYVPQNAYLFTGTIEENIGYGRLGATHEEIVAAAVAAHAHDFILEQPDGYHTQVGEQGGLLSGGQRQRIAIARALLKDAPILLLDEATSALDSESEQQVQAALDVLMQGRTTVAVAHRLSTIEHADRILVLDAGQIVEQGSHTELLAAGGPYRRLHELQFAGSAGNS